MVYKKNEKWWDYIDFTNLNKACLKDSFALPKIYMMVDTIAGHEVLSFIDVYLGYNLIMVHSND